MRKLFIGLLAALLPVMGLADDILVIGGKLVRTGGSLIVARETIPWTPALVGTNLVGWYDAADADTITFGAGVSISQWGDKSGNGYDMTQTSAGNQPEYLTNAINGLSVAWFSSTFDRMWTNGISDIDCSQVCIVSLGMGKTAGDTPNYGFVQNTAVSDMLFNRFQAQVTQGKLWGVFTLDTVQSAFSSANYADLAEEIPVVSATWYDGAIYVQRSDGGTHALTNDVADGATFTINEIHVGRNPFGGNTPRHYHGEYIVLKTADAATIEKIEGYLAHKWGTASKLPTSHPYRWKRPTVPIWTPEDISTEAWYAASDASTITLNGSTVSQWDDKSGNDRHVSNGTGSTQPIYNTNDPLLNNLPSIGYDGKRTFLTSTNTFALQNVYVAATYTNATFTSWDMILADVADNSPRLGGYSGRAYFQDNGWAEVFVNGDTNTDYSSTSGALPISMLPLNGGVLTCLSTASYTADTFWRIMSGPNSWQQWGRHGAFGEVIFTDGVDTLDTRQRVEGYLAWKWGLEDELPSGHPYKWIQPTKE